MEIPPFFVAFLHIVQVMPHFTARNPRLFASPNDHLPMRCRNCRYRPRDVAAGDWAQGVKGGWRGEARKSMEEYK